MFQSPKFENHVNHKRNCSNSSFVIPPLPQSQKDNLNNLNGGQVRSVQTQPGVPTSPVLIRHSSRESLNGSRPMSTRDYLMRELSDMDRSEEQHLRRLMQVDDKDDCTALSRLFFQESTMVHGVARAAKLGSDLRRFMWIALVFLCMAGFTWQTCSLLVDFFRWPVTVVTQMEHTRTLTFPSISVCNMNKVPSLPSLQISDDFQALC